MAQFFSSDHHLFHKNILEFDDRPFKSIEEMNEQIIARHNSLVAKDDTWHAVGDMLLGEKFAQNIGIFSRFNGNRKLYPGNHDRVSQINKLKYRELYFDAYSENFRIMPDNFQVVVQGHRFNIGHLPYQGDHTEDPRFVEYRPEDKGVPLIHGHTHSKEKISFSEKGTLQICVSLTAWDYYPAHENEIIELMETYV